MTEINKTIEETERLLAAATPGPWAHNWVGDCILGSDDEGHVIAALDLHTRANADLMAHAPTALRDFVKEVQGLQHSLADARLQIDAIHGSSKVHMSRVAELTQTLKEVQEAHQVAKGRVTELESAQTLRPMADVPIGATRVLARHTTLGWFPVARARDELEFRGRQGMDWSGEYFHGWIPMPVLPDKREKGGS